jgi:hypothetical protein
VRRPVRQHLRPLLQARSVSPPLSVSPAPNDHVATPQDYLRSSSPPS